MFKVSFLYRFRYYIDYIKCNLYDNELITDYRLFLKCVLFSDTMLQSL